MKIKICGITNIKDAKLAVKYGVDALGFVFYSNSKRYVDIKNAKNIIEALPPFLHKIGVFVNEEYNVVNEIASEVKLTAVQLHGDEDAEYIQKINYPVIKSYGIDESFDFEKLSDFSSYVLLDVKDENEYGGTGNKFDWALIPKNIQGSIILAGGISIVNIEYIFHNIKPYAVDLSSSIEESFGKKDRKKTIRILEKIRELNGNN